MGKSKVYLVSTDDRGVGARRCLAYIGVPDYSGKTVYVKPNFNTADPAPGSTHNDTLDALLEAVRAANPAKLTLGERSGPAEAAQVFAQRGIPALCEKYGAELLNLETMPAEGWVKVERDDLHWQGGYFEVPKALLKADAVVGTCCLKTHGFGGVYSNSLKLAVGLTPKDFGKLHGSQDIRKLIAEINLAYTPDFILSDAVEVFTDGGPMEGTRKRANVMLIGSDRVALDAVGLALLKSLGSNSAITDTPIWAQEQIARAVELGLGAASAEEIELVTDDDASAEVAARVREILVQG
ncbi:MAG: DUF362 domain-containing protein [Oscillospiraceae bacterium]|jgi:uncharacterized protein (DUF362 family)|nr:DUF362 domain-containing protein [Oscillospiraceae bacterium]